MGVINFSRGSKIMEKLIWLWKIIVLILIYCVVSLVLCFIGKYPKYCSVCEFSRIWNGYNSPVCLSKIVKNLPNVQKKISYFWVPYS